MFSISNEQAVSVWAELEDAYRGEHGYGGHVAEVYCYRLQGRSPALDRGELAPTFRVDEDRRRRSRETAEALAWLLATFVRVRGAEVEVDGRPLGEWLENQVPVGISHRVRVGAWPAGSR